MEDPRLAAEDPELAALLEGNPELAEVALLLRASRPRPVPDPRFQRQLRAHLLAEADRETVGRGLRRWWRHPRPLVGGIAAGLAAMAAAVALTLGSSHSRDHETVAISSAVSGQYALTGDVITVSFNQPMNEASVVSGLHLTPATQVRTSWRGNTLVVTPVHHLAANTPYTLTIDRSAARSKAGGAAERDLRIAFGTAPTPTPSSPAQRSPSAPLLDVHPLGPTGPGAAMTFAPDGSPVATAALLPPSPTPAASPAPSPPGGEEGRPAPEAASPAAAAPAASTPGTTAPAPTPAAAAAPTPATAEYGGDASPRRLGPAASAAAFSPDGRSLALAVPAPGGAAITLVRPPGTESSVVATTDTPATELAWSAAGSIVFVGGGQVRAVDPATQAVRTLATVPADAGPVHLSPDGSRAAAGGSLLDLTSGASRPLTAGRGPAAFSPDGHTIAWVDGASVAVSPVDADQVTRVPVEAASRVSQLAVSSDARRLAYSAGSGGDAGTSVLALPGGRLVGRADRAAAALAFSARGDRLAVLLTGAPGGQATAGVASVPASVGPGTPAAVPPAALDAAGRFVAAQLARDPAALQRVTLGGVDPDRVLVAGMARSDLIQALSHRDGTVTARVRLVGNPSAGRPAPLSEEETLTLVPTAGGFSVSEAALAPVRDLPPGPHVVGVSPGRDPGLVLVSFDSDLLPSTVAGAISSRDAAGQRLSETVDYDADTRTAAVRLQPAPGGGTLVVGTSLQDVAGEHLDSPFSADLAG